MFSLHLLVELYLNKGKPLYCVYVDMKKCFDSVYRNALLYKLYKLGINGKMLKIVRGMYELVKCRVRHCGTYSDFMEIAVGLKQGEICSPILYSLFVEDLELYLQGSPENCLTLHDLTIIILLYADDMAILAETPEALQHNFDLLKQYCDKWGLSVNADKTKVMIFRRRKQNRANERWYYNGTKLEVVSEFNYLGTVFSSTGSFNKNQSMLTGKALKAMNLLLSKIKTFNFSLKTYCQLFDAFVVSTFNYSSEVWDNCKSKEIERIHLRFCKRILKVKLSTSNYAVYGELGRLPLYINRFVKIVKYWLKVIDTDNCIVKTLYNLAYKDWREGKNN